MRSTSLRTASRTRRARLTAFALLALVLLPFTRPFSTCPLSALVGRHDVHAAVGCSHSAVLDVTVSLDTTPAGAVVEEETKDDVLPAAVHVPLVHDAGVQVVVAGVIAGSSVRRVTPSLRL